MSTFMSLAIVAFAILLPVYITANCLHWLRSPLRSVPGPLLARFTDLWYCYQLKKGGYEKVILKLHQQHGPVVRYGPNRYSINDTASLKTIYGQGSQFPKSEWYSALQPSDAIWNLFATRDIQHHAQSRRLYSNAYSMTSLVHYEPYLDECAAIFSQRLLEFSKAGTTINAGHWLQCFAFDVIGFITYGQRLGFLDQGEDIASVIHNLDQRVEYTSLVGIFPRLNRLALKVSPRNSRPGGNNTAYLLRYTQELMEREMSSPKPVMESQTQDADAPSSETFLSKFLAKHYSAPETFTKYHILTGCMVNMFGGSDTTGVSLAAILYHLLKNPGTLTKLREEIEDFAHRGELSEAPSFKETQRMPYLQAVIKEALRIHPAVGTPLERIVPKGGATICGKFFPEGSVVASHTWVQHRNEFVFGDDVECFRPDRWLESDEAKLSAMNKNWMPFGLGSRNCIGKHISILEISKLIPRIIRDFDFQLQGPAAVPGGSWETYNVGFVKPRSFYISVKSRR
ncbi:cytochrome P450 oxidoreductase [Apiospora kogelbergensis]|uniref:Cytochrome P450 oxidoreductase n=1 Tax=Apiospora kogelbergensis TaxID=1337665 RepID=A0AAW0QXZ4_9PEZI